MALGRAERAELGRVQTRRGLAMPARALGDNFDFERVEAKKLGVFYQIVGVAIVAVVIDDAPDVVQQRRMLQQLTRLRTGLEDRRRRVVNLQRQPRHLRAVPVERAEAPRPRAPPLTMLSRIPSRSAQVHATSSGTAACASRKSASTAAAGSRSVRLGSAPGSSPRSSEESFSSRLRNHAMSVAGTLSPCSRSCSPSRATRAIATSALMVPDVPIARMAPARRALRI